MTQYYESFIALVSSPEDMAPTKTKRLPRGIRAKLELRRWLLRSAGAQRVHIVGCARSGTTMLHYSMIAFADTTLVDKETSVLWAPTLAESSRFLRERLSGGPRRHIITKREYGWYFPSHVDDLVDCARREQIGLINIVRDPRDVLASHHALDAQEQAYVEPERWLASVRAAEDLFQRLASHSAKITLRYEDLVSDPATAEKLIANCFAMKLRDGIKSMGRLKDNLERLEASTEMAVYMQQIRNFDPRTIGGWRRDPRKSEHVERLLNSSVIAGELQEFMQRHGYQ